MKTSRVFAFIILGLMVFENGCRSRQAAPSASDHPGTGIPLELAVERAASIRDVRYDLSLKIPETVSEQILGHVTVRFNLDDVSHAVALDFEPGAAAINSVSIHNRPIAVDVINGHIVIAKDFLSPGDNSVDITFRAGDASLNRTRDFMYALFVPARAHLAFPCFDQPDLKARYTLALEVPAAWQSVSNGAEIGREQHGDRVQLRYAETKPIPTYLFTFATGKFQVETAERNGRVFHMYHRETD